MPLVLLVAMECWLTGSGTDSSVGDPMGAGPGMAPLPLAIEVERASWRRFRLSAEDRTNALLWIEQLGRPRYAERELAQRRLLGLGPGAISLLRNLPIDPSPERQKRLHACLRILERQVDVPRMEAGIRRHVCPALAPDLWQLLESCPDGHLEEEIAGELLRLALEDAATRKLIDAGAGSSFPAQRACALLQQEIGREARKRTLAWKRLKEQVPHWPVCRAEMPVDWAIGPSFRARRTFERFLEALARRDRAEMARLCRLPFCLGGWLKLQSARELDELLTQTLDELKGTTWSCEILDVVRLETYAPADPERALLRDVPANHIRVVSVRMTLKGDAPVEGHFFILLAPRPAVMGIGGR